MSTSTAHIPDWIDQYDAITARVAVVDLADRTQIEVRGADRAGFLHNLCTNEIRKLAPGAGCETFLTTVQGKTLAHVFIFNTGESLVVDTVAGQAETVLKHFDHYLVCEQVELIDRTAEWSELLLAGRDSRQLLARLIVEEIPESHLDNRSVCLGGKPVSLRRADIAGPLGFLVSAQAEQLAQIRGALVDAGAAPCGQAAFEAARIEWGFPLFGVDITDKNLPQEIARDQAAISFTKGCYLGQETVARIDALGHVNKMLVQIAFAGSSVPERGTRLSADSQAAGEVTSAAYSPRCGRPLALGFVRRGSNQPHKALTSPSGPAEVVVLHGD